MSLVKKSDLKQYIQEGSDINDTLVDSLISRVEEDFKAFLGGVTFDATSDYTEYTEYYDGDSTNVLIVDRAPIRSITSIHLDSDRLFGASTQVSASAILDTHFASGLICLDSLVFTYGIKTVKVVYKAGWKTTDAPADFKQIIVNEVLALLLEGTGAINVVEEGEFFYRPDKLRKAAANLKEKYKRFC